MPDYILITTYAATSPERKLQEKVRGVFEKQPLQVALRELSEMAGTSIIVDNRATEKAKSVVSATFLNDIDLAGALRVLTEMADLKVIVLDGAIFVTTAEHVTLLRKEHADKSRTQPPPVTGIIPGAAGFPGTPSIPFEHGGDPFWPYSPQRPFGPAGSPVCLNNSARGCAAIQRQGTAGWPTLKACVERLQCGGLALGGTPLELFGHGNTHSARQRAAKPVPAFLDPSRVGGSAKQFTCLGFEEGDEGAE